MQAGAESLVESRGRETAGSHTALCRVACSGPVACSDPLERDILPLLPSRLQRLVREWTARNPVEASTIVEVRLRSGYPLCLCYSGADALLGAGRAAHAGPATGSTGSLAPVSREEIQKTLSLVSNSSYYALESEFANGYVTIPGGHRVGLAGQVSVWADGSVRVREVSAMNFRVARAVPGVAEKIAGRLAGAGGRLLSTLIISPPGCGKTTALRDLCRISAQGYPPAGIRPSQVGVVDERSEIAACYMGVPQHDLGPRVDVLDRCPKAKGIMMLLRSMGPGVIATDEIGSDEDARAVGTALSAGASILATCHGDGVDALRRRPHSSWLVSSGYFERVVALSRRNGPGTVEHAGAFQ